MCQKLGWTKIAEAIHCNSVCNHKLCFSISAVRYCTVWKHLHIFRPASWVWVCVGLCLSQLVWVCTVHSASQTHATKSALCFRNNDFFFANAFECKSVRQTLARIRHISSLQDIRLYLHPMILLRYRNFHNKCMIFAKLPFS